MSGTRNTLDDLQNHLFAELERLGDEDLSGDALEQELRRAKAVTEVAAQCIANANTVIRAAQVVDGAANSKLRLPRMVAVE